MPQSLGENDNWTQVSWTCDYKGEPLAISTWYDHQGWDFVGCVVDIPLKGKDGFFFVKYTGSIEGIECDDIEGVCKRGDKKIYHFGVEKLGGRLVLFRPQNIHAIREHHSQAKELAETEYIFGEKVPRVKDQVKEDIIELTADYIKAEEEKLMAKEDEIKTAEMVSIAS